MTQRQTVPTAYISVGKNRLSHSDGKVFLRDGTEFEIELTNLDTSTIKANIEINGHPISNTGLILRPGQHYYLERYIDDPRKFLFETYKVDDNQEVRDAIANNGLVTVKFYREKMSYTVRNPHWDNTVWWTTPNTYYYDNTTVPTSFTTGQTTIRASVSNMSADINNPPILTDASSKIDPQIETGRVEHGGHSTEKFDTVYKPFDLIPFHVVTLKLLPQVHQTTDIRVYCTGCGRRLRKKDVFCSKCGTRK